MDFKHFQSRGRESPRWSRSSNDTSFQLLGPDDFIYFPQTTCLKLFAYLSQPIHFCWGIDTYEDQFWLKYSLPDICWKEQVHSTTFFDNFIQSWLKNNKKTSMVTRIGLCTSDHQWNAWLPVPTQSWNLSRSLNRCKIPDQKGIRPFDHCGHVVIYWKSLNMWPHFRWVYIIVYCIWLRSAGKSY